MKVIDRGQANDSLAAFAERVGDEALVVTRNGRPIAALLPVGESDWETVSLSLNPEFIEIIQRSRARQQAEGGISSDEMRRRLGVPRTKPSGRARRAKSSSASRKRRS